MTNESMVPFDAALRPVSRHLDALDTSAVSADRRALFESVFARLAPYLGTSEAHVVLAQVMITLKLEGVIGKDLTKRDVAKLDLIRDAVLQNPEKRDAAVSMAKKYLK